MALNEINSQQISRHQGFRKGALTIAAAICVLGLAGCSSTRDVAEPRVDPDAARAEIVRLLPGGVTNPTGWAIDMFAAFEALHLPPTRENSCAVIAVTQQESTFQVDPVVPGLPAIARKEIESRAARYHIPISVVNVALKLTSPNGSSYSDRLRTVRTEKDLSLLFEDFIGMVPLGRQLFGDLNPVRTGGPMQVSIAYAEQHAQTKHYPYASIESGSIRHEVFTRRGGIYFGTAHLLDYPAQYDDMLFRFADFNAGHYASRNAALQSAVASLAKKKLTLDGDLLRYGSGSGEPSNTELAIRSLAQQLDLGNAEIRRDLEREKDAAFAETRLYRRVFDLSDRQLGRQAPRGVVPQIRLQSAKITRNLTTEWFAQRVNQRYEQCLGRGIARGEATKSK